MTRPKNLRDYVTMPFFPEASGMGRGIFVFCCISAVVFVAGCDKKVEEPLASENPAAVAKPRSAMNGGDALGPRYDARLAEGVDFSKVGTPSFLASAKGLDSIESWGRWSNARLSPSVVLTFAEPLPRRLTLVISAQATGQNGALPTVVRIGDVQKTFVVGAAGFATAKIDIDLHDEERSIEIIPPAPVVPKEQGWSSDTRKLGIGLASLKIQTR